MAAARLLSWFKDNGGTLHQAVEIAYNNHDGYHLRTTADLDSTVPLLHCPRTVTLSVQDAEAESEWPSAFLFRFRRSSPEVLIRFQLMYEHSKGSTSKWWPYLATLPPPQQDPDASLFNTPLWFSESDRLWLRGTNLEAAIADRENAWRKELHEGLSLLRGATDVTPYTWLMYRWAATILTSRCFPQWARQSAVSRSSIVSTGGASTIGETAEELNTPVLCPVFDVANHDPRAQVTWIIDEEGYTLFTADRYAPGAQIFNNYGPKGNEELLMGYGFTLANNSGDVFSLSLPSHNTSSLLEAQDPKSQWQPKNAKPIQRQCGRLFELGITGVVPETLLDALGPMVANERELKAMHGVDSTSTVLHGRLLIQIKFQLRKALIQRRRNIRMFDSDLQATPANDRQAHALRYRRGQQSLLDLHVARLARGLAEDPPRAQVISLEDSLSSVPGSITDALRAALQSASITRNASRLQKQGLQDVVFTLFVCLAWLTYMDDAEGCGSSSDLSSSSSPSSSSSCTGPETLKSCIARWPTFLSSSYCPPPGGGPAETRATCKRVICFCPPESRLPADTEQSGITPLSGGEEAEDNRAADTAFSIVQRAALHGGSRSVFRKGRWCKDFLMWGLMIWRAEAVVLPASLLRGNASDRDEEAERGSRQEAQEAQEGQEGEEAEEEERALFLEVGAEATDKARHTTSSPGPPRKKQKPSRVNVA